MTWIRKAAVALVCILGWAALAAPGPARASTPPHPRSHIWAWGSARGGELGIDATPIPPQVVLVRPAPVPIHLTVPLQVTSGGSVVLGLYKGMVWAWGTGPLGNGSTGSKTPVQITTLPPVRELAATGGGQAFYALADNGTVWAWGSGTNGELGDGSFASSSTPVQVTGLTGVGAIYAGSDTAYALQVPDHRLFAWGMGTNGELGNGQMANSDTPVPVQVPDGVHQVATQCGSTYALSSRRPGRVFAWGGNGDGQLGDGTRSNAATPVLVRRVTTATTVLAACNSGYAITGTAHTVMAWGRGDQGQMGDGHKATRVLPVPVTGLSGVASLTAGPATVYALLSDHTLWAWGEGHGGNLGNGQFTNSPVPVQVTGITAPVKTVVSAPTGGNASGFVATEALGTDGSVWGWGAAWGFGEGATGLGIDGGTATPGQVGRVPAICGIATDGGGVWFASTCS